MHSTAKIVHKNTHSQEHRSGRRAGILATKTEHKVIQIFHTVKLTDSIGNETEVLESVLSFGSGHRIRANPECSPVVQDGFWYPCFLFKQNIDGRNRRRRRRREEEEEAKKVEATCVIQSVNFIITTALLKIRALMPPTSGYSGKAYW